MTVIIWVKHKWDVYLASDWRTSWYHEIITDSSIKQFQYNWTWIWISGNVSTEQMLKYVLETQINDKSFKIRTETDVYAIYSLISKHAKDIGYTDPFWEIGGNVVISAIFATDNWKLFKLRPDWAVMEFKDFTACWCWEDIATTLLKQIKIEKPERDIKFVMKQVFKQSALCWGKITINCIPWKKTKSKIKAILKSKKKK